MMNMKKHPLLSIDDIAGIGTWAAVSGISLFWLINAPQKYSENILIVVLLFALYLISFILATRNPPVFKENSTKLLIFGIQLISAYCIVWYLPLPYLSILTIIWVSILPHYFSLGTSIAIAFIVVTTWFSFYGIHWQQNTLFEGVLFGTFHFFAISVTHNAKKAELATEKAELLNTELMATQQLLSEVSRQNERSRIARDLHDLLGHHLTALIINLQVAGHISEGDAKAKIEHCHSIAKLLLSDVREAVTALKDNQAIDFHNLVDLMIDNIPTLSIINHIDTQLNLENMNIAKSLLSCIQEAITNSLRHSGATEFQIIMNQQQDYIILQLFDNGQVQGNIIEGNGITGMRERINEVNGELALDIKNASLHINIKIPLIHESSKIPSV